MIELSVFQIVYLTSRYAKQICHSGDLKEDPARSAESALGSRASKKSAKQETEFLMNPICEISHHHIHCQRNPVYRSVASNALKEAFTMEIGEEISQKIRVCFRSTRQF